MLWHARCKKCGKAKVEQQRWIVDNLRREGIHHGLQPERFDVDSGVDEDLLSSFGTTPLIIASRHGNMAVVRSLLDRGANVNEEAPFTKSTALIEAARKGKVEIVQLLLNRGAEINRGDIDGVTALYAASEAGFIKVVRFLIRRTADVNCSTRDGWTALFPAVSGGHTEIVRTLLQNKAKVNQCDKYGSIPLIFAACNGYVEIAKLLIDAGACISHINEADTLTPLIEACYNGQKDIVQLLIDRGADLSYKTTKSSGDIAAGQTAVMVAAERGHYEIMKMLVKHQNSLIIKKKPSKITASNTCLMMMIADLLKRGTCSLLLRLAMLTFFNYELQ